MNSFDFLPRRIDVILPSIRIGDKFARRQINTRQAIEYLQTGLYRQQFSVSGQFIGIVYSPETAKPSRPNYIPEQMPMLEVPGVKFMQPSKATPEYLRTVSPIAFA